MARYHQNFVRGSLGSTLLIGGLTIDEADLDATGLSGLIQVDESHMPLILDPGGVNGDPEIVWITDFDVSGGGDATIVRAQEGTTAREHPSGTTFIQGPTAYDHNYGSLTSASVSGSVDIAADEAEFYHYTLTGDTTFTFSGSASGVTNRFTAVVQQDGTGSHSVTWPTVTWINNDVEPDVRTAAGSVTVYNFVSTDDGTTWIGWSHNSHNLDDLNDVTETAITTDDLLQWNGSAWVNQAPSDVGADIEFGDLSDVDMATEAPVDRDTVEFDGSDWVPVDPRLSRIGQTYVYFSTSQSIPVATWTTVAFDLETNDNAAIHSTSAAATTIAAASNGAALPQGTINVASTSGFASSGFITVVISSTRRLVAYTGTTATTFTGCTLGVGTMSTGGAVAQVYPSLTSDVSGILWNQAIVTGWEAINTGNYFAHRMVASGIFVVFTAHTPTLNVNQQGFSSSLVNNINASTVIQAFASSASGSVNAGSVIIRKQGSALPAWNLVPQGAVY